MAAAEETEHVCDPDRKVDYELFQLRAEVSGLGTEIEDYLSSAHGRFEQWYAEHERQPASEDDLPAEPED